MELKEMISHIKPIDQGAVKQAEDRWLTIAKPLFSLGKLETAITLMAGIKGTSQFTLEKKGLIIMCADNGVVEEGVTQTGQEVTAIVADNFTKQATSVCMMAEEAKVDLFPIDIGMAVDVSSVSHPRNKVAYGTRNLKKEPAMTREQAVAAIQIGIRIVEERKQEGYDILATGEMGIGNTTTSSAVAAVLLHRPVEEVTGRGAGLTGIGLQKKIGVIEEALSLHCPNPEDPIEVIAKVGGLDIAGLVGVFLGGAIYHIPIVIDGFISAVAALAAVRMAPLTREYMLPSHVSKEPAGQMVLDALELSPFLTCDMCLGEGTGAVAVMPLLNMGLKVYLQMSTFQDITIEEYEVYQ
ncbi:MAG: nicotinate-nucleotide--dimethylbenzimidazole phosphoribosyltransferase [Lachnospiraceae bacterium]